MRKWNINVIIHVMIWSGFLMLLLLFIPFYDIHFLQHPVLFVGMFFFSDRLLLSQFACFGTCFFSQEKIFRFCGDNPVHIVGLSLFIESFGMVAVTGRERFRNVAHVLGWTTPFTQGKTPCF